MLKAAHQTNFSLQMIRFRSAKSGPNPSKLTDGVPRNDASNFGQNCLNSYFLWKICHLQIPISYWQ